MARANSTHIEIVRQGAEALAEYRRENPSVVLNLSGADLSDLELEDMSLRGSTLIGVDLSRARLIRCDLSFCNLRGSTLRFATLKDSLLHRAFLNDANLIESDLAGCDLSSVDFTAATLSKVAFRGLSYGSMRAAAHLAGAKFDGVNLRGIDLSWCMLRESSFVRADLTRANLVGANLVGADLTGARMVHTDLQGANLRRTSLQETTLFDALFGHTSLDDVDLSEPQGLQSCRHSLQSSIGLDTVIRSEGKIPDDFLRGCGYDPRIQTMLSGTIAERTDVLNELATEDGPLRLQSCFISYSTKDRPFVDRLQHALNAAGVDYWYAPEHGRWGEKITDQIDREISVRDRVILVCSASSLQDSDWVQWEIERAGEKVFPVMLDDALTEWNHPRATRLREILAGDFRGALEGEPFEKAVSRLVAGLGPIRDQGRPGLT